MSRRAFHDDDDDQGSMLPPEPDRHPLACRANGCPQLGTSSVEGGNLLCNAHSRTKPADWNALTFQLRKLDWLGRLIVRVNRCGTDAQWQALATDFWRRQGDEHMVPTGSEIGRRGLYEQRLRDELLYRAGVIAVRPQPRVIEQWAPRGAIPSNFTGA